MTLGEHYKYTLEWIVYNFCWLKFECHYNDGYVNVSMPWYTKDALRNIKHQPSKKIKYLTHEYFPVDYSKHETAQYATTTNKSPILSSK